jgi:hypothetical protein
LATESGLWEAEIDPPLLFALTNAQ